MKYAFTMVPDSLGTGAAEDARRFGDVGADTLGHIAEAYTKGEADNGRRGPLNLSSLARLGPAKTHEGPTGFILAEIDGNTRIIGAHVWVYEVPSGKDIPSGHQGIVGVPVLFEWGYFFDHENSLPQELLGGLVERADLPGYLGNCHSSGTVTLDQLGEEHVRTGRPTFYTSADSVFQITRHEETFGLGKLYELYEIAREELTDGGYNIGRVTAHPSTGDKAGSSQRTGDRHDLAVEPPVPTMLQKLVDKKHGQVVSVDKIVGIYANCGTAKEVKVTGLDALFDAITKEMEEAGDNTIALTNSVDFDSSWGHRRDAVGYTVSLELFDRHPPELMSLLHNGNILVLIADHGCDPTWTGTNHMCEHTPVLACDPRVKPGSLGYREAFTDIGQTLAEYFGTSDMEYGRAML